MSILNPQFAGWLLNATAEMGRIEENRIAVNCAIDLKSEAVICENIAKEIPIQPNALDAGKADWWDGPTVGCGSPETKKSVGGIPVVQPI
jgi:hypothetical protein